MPRVLLYITVFVSGMCTLAIELSASRLLGSVFGTSNLVWANVIGLMLLYLSVGYFVGGRLADRSPYPRTLFRILLWAAFLSALIPLVARPILQSAATAVMNVDAAVVVGAFLAVLVLFSGPVTLLGCVSPFALRLAIKDLRLTGQVAGRIFAISTLGSLFGTFLPVLLLIPQLGYPEDISLLRRLALPDRAARHVAHGRTLPPAFALDAAGHCTVHPAGLRWPAARRAARQDVAA